MFFSLVLQMTFLFLIAGVIWLYRSGFLTGRQCFSQAWLVVGPNGSDFIYPVLIVVTLFLLLSLTVWYLRRPFQKTHPFVSFQRYPSVAFLVSLGFSRDFSEALSVMMTAYGTLYLMTHFLDLAREWYNPTYRAEYPEVFKFSFFPGLWVLAGTSVWASIGGAFTPLDLVRLVQLSYGLIYFGGHLTYLWNPLISRVVYRVRRFCQFLSIQWLIDLVGPPEEAPPLILTTLPRIGAGALLGSVVTWVGVRTVSKNAALEREQREKLHQEKLHQSQLRHESQMKEDRLRQDLDIEEGRWRQQRDLDDRLAQRHLNHLESSRRHEAKMEEIRRHHHKVEEDLRESLKNKSEGPKLVASPVSWSDLVDGLIVGFLTGNFNETLLIRLLAGLLVRVKFRPPR